LVKKILFARLFLMFTIPIVCLGADTSTAGPQAFLAESVYEFAPLVEGTTVEHDFVIQNHGDAPLLILGLKSG
jgi:hypothetical protein